MGTFPRTEVGGQSVSRMIIGTNWFLGWSHTSAAKDDFIKTCVRERGKIADILEVFFRAGVDTVMGLSQVDPLIDAVHEAEDRTGVKGIIVSTPYLPVTRETPSKGFDLDEVKRILDLEVSLGSRFILPHQSTTDPMVDRATREIRQMAPVCELIRERGMIPGLSTHMPESIIYSDETGLDVETYISIYNSAGFLMPVEVDWINRVIYNAKKPVMTIKPMAAGQVRPFQAMNFVWNTIRPQDMVTVGTMTPAEAQELVDMSLQILEGVESRITLQETRSKASIRPAE
jgi:hypothetical protein